MNKLPWNEKKAKGLGWDIARVKAFYAAYGIELEAMEVNEGMGKVCVVCEERKPRNDEYWGRYLYKGSSSASNPRMPGGGRFKKVCLECEDLGHDPATIALEKRRERARRYDEAKRARQAADALRAGGSAN